MIVHTVRFSEFESYDINDDCEKVMYMATTSTGSFFATAPIDKDQVKRKKQFKEKVLELMGQGLEPGEIQFEDDS